MKSIGRIAGLALLMVAIGCASQSRKLYQSLATVEVVTTGAFASYLDLVVTGKLSTNSVPVVSADYNAFKQVWSAAVVIAQWQTNSVAPANVTAASTKVLLDINQAKGAK